MDDEVDTMLMKKQNMRDKEVIGFLTIHTSEMCLIFKNYKYAVTE